MSPPTHPRGGPLVDVISTVKYLLLEDEGATVVVCRERDVNFLKNWAEFSDGSSQLSWCPPAIHVAGTYLMVVEV